MRFRELATEKINPDTFKSGFKKEKKIGNLRFVATARSDYTDDKIPGLIIHVYDESRGRRNPEIATARLLVGSWEDLNDPALKARPAFVHVDSEYRRQGIASEMYNFARELGNEIKPSDAQSSLGKAFWAHGQGGVGRGYKPPPAPVSQAPEPKPSLFNKLKSVFAEGTDFTNAVNSIERLIKQNNIEFKSYEDLLKFVAGRKFLQAQRNDQRFINDVARSVLRRLHTVNEVRSDDDPETNYYDADDGFEELKVSQRIQKYFYDRGYGYLGEGRDQMAFLTPRGTVLKILGIGEDQREDVVKTYVGFFMRNQRNPHYPRIYNAGDFTVDGESYFLYEMEYLNPVHGEEHVLYYLEELMSALPRGEHALNAFYNNTPRPPELDEQQVDGLVLATQDLEDALGGQAPLDLRSIENLGRRDNGQLVIIDPFSL